MTKAVDDTKEKLKEFAKSSNSKYINLLKDLIVQGMTQMIEEECFVRVRKEDKDAVSGILSKCEKEYTDIMKKETGRDYKCQLKIDTNFLEIP